MSDLTYNIDICPECDSNLTVTAQFDDTDDDKPAPYQGYWLVCEECGHDSVLAILHYPDGAYAGITEAAEGDCEECGDEADWRVEHNTRGVSRACDAHTLDLFPTTYRETVVRLDRLRP